VGKRLEKHQHGIAWPFFAEGLDALQAGARRRGRGVLSGTEASRQRKHN
jgi:hypothetical protein